MKYRLLDGHEVAGNSYTDIVAAMNNDKMTPASNLSTYRKAMAKRVKEMYERDIDPTSDKTLVLGMAEVGLIERL